MWNIFYINEVGKGLYRISIYLPFWAWAKWYFFLGLQWMLLLWYILLKHRWCTKLYWFQVCSIVIWQLQTLWIIHHDKCSSHHHTKTSQYYCPCSLQPCLPLLQRFPVGARSLVTAQLPWEQGDSLLCIHLRLNLPSLKSPSSFHFPGPVVFASGTPTFCVVFGG